ncbi:MAG: NAD(P)/FAD-dependent oxidoreductase, partial [Gemmatimonadales bacterium]
MSARPDVFVSGLGPAGAATAIRLARLGLTVTAADRAVFPREKICSEYLSPEAVRQLEDLGVLAELRPHAVALDGATIHGPAGARMTGLVHRTLPAGLPASGLSI